MADTGSTLLIEELSGTGGAGKRKLVLTGAGLPLQGAEWSGENNVKITWLPGNKVATRQVVGPKILPSSWSGEWHIDQLMQTPAQWTDKGLTGIVFEPIQLFEIFESLRSEGRLLRVTWSVRDRMTLASRGNSVQGSFGAAGRIVCTGGLDKFAAKFDRAEDAVWDATFGWVSRGPVQAPARSSASGSLAASSGRVGAASLKLANTASGSPYQSFDPSVYGSASFFTLGRYESLPGPLETKVLNTSLAVAKLANGVAQATALGGQLSSQPTAVTQMAVAHARDATKQANQALDEFGRVPFELTTTKPFLGDALAGWLRYQEVELALEELAGETIILRDQLQAGFSSPSLTGARSALGIAAKVAKIRVCKKGDTPETVSRDEYGSDQYSALLCAANGLAWHTVSFPVGYPLIVPPLGPNPQP